MYLGGYKIGVECLHGWIALRMLGAYLLIARRHIALQLGYRSHGPVLIGSTHGRAWAQGK